MVSRRSEDLRFRIPYRRQVKSGARDSGPCRRLSRFQVPRGTARAIRSPELSKRRSTAMCLASKLIRQLLVQCGQDRASTKIVVLTMQEKISGVLRDFERITNFVSHRCRHASYGSLTCRRRGAKSTNLHSNEIGPTRQNWLGIFVSERIPDRKCPNTGTTRAGGYASHQLLPLATHPHHGIYEFLVERQCLFTSLAIAVQGPYPVRQEDYSCELNAWRG